MRKYSSEDVERLIKDMYRIALPLGDKILHVIPQEFTVDDERMLLRSHRHVRTQTRTNFHIITGQITVSKHHPMY